MARPIRFQYPGAIYHVMARGDGGKDEFETGDDRKAFVHRLGQACGNHGWRVHAWVLTGNHFHLLLETPQANLVLGMKWLMSTFSQGDQQMIALPGSQYDKGTGHLSDFLRDIFIPPQ